MQIRSSTRRRKVSTGPIKSTIYRNIYNFYSNKKLFFPKPNFARKQDNSFIRKIIFKVIIFCVSFTLTKNAWCCNCFLNNIQVPTKICAATTDPVFFFFFFFLKRVFSWAKPADTLFQMIK